MRPSLLLVLPTLALAGCGSSASLSADLGARARAAGARLVVHDYAYGINDHTTSRVRYPTNPPTNGPHHPEWAVDGNYAGLEPPRTEKLVHAQEHGRIVVQYRRGIAKAKLARLEALYDEDPFHVLLVENATQMPCEVAVTAWGRAALCPKLTAASLDLIRSFRDAYRDKGPEIVA